MSVAQSNGMSEHRHVSNRPISSKSQTGPRSRPRLSSLLALSLSIFSVGCGGALFPTGSSLGHGVTNAASSGDPLSNAYSVKAYAILQANCVRCHDGASAQGGVSGLTNGAHLVSSGLVKPGSPSTSTLYNAIATKVMPPAPNTALSAGDIQTISDWITAAKQVAATPTPPPTASPVPTATPLPATFTALKNTIFQPKCVGCHSAANMAGGYAYDSYNAVLASVNTAMPTGSAVYTSTSQGVMPKNGTPLSAAQEDQILRWIQGGALNN